MHGIETSEAGLIQQLALDDETAFAEIYNLYWNKLYLAAFNKIRSSENAKEIVQDIFLDLWHRRKENRIIDLEAYLFSAVRYQVLDFIKKEIIRKKYSDSILLYEVDSSDTPLNNLAFVELRHSISKAIQTLPDKTRSIFEMNRLQYKSAEQISEESGIPVRTVEYHITQGLKVLRSHLKEYFVVLITAFTSWVQL